MEFVQEFLNTVLRDNDIYHAAPSRYTNMMRYLKNYNNTAFPNITV